MDPKSFRSKKGPEAIIQAKIIKALLVRGWLVKETHGNIYQYGFPDLYCSHYHQGIRWVEVKNPIKWEFTPAQLEWFPKFTAHGTGIWILTSDTPEELEKLKRPPNWAMFYLEGQKSC